MSIDISAVIMTFNRSHYLDRCLESLINQQYPKDRFEVIVINDGGVDNSEDIVKKYNTCGCNIYYYYQPHRGISSARNHGARRACGSLLVFLADDYVLPSGYLQEVSCFFEEFQDANVFRPRLVARPLERFIVKTLQLRYEAGINFLLSKQAFSVNGYIKSYNLPAGGAAAFRRKILDKVGLFDEKIVFGEEVDMGKRLLAAGEAVYYDPHLEVTHLFLENTPQYFLKFFRLGQHIYPLKEKYGKDYRWVPTDLKSAIMLIAHLAVNPFYKIRYSGRPIFHLAIYYPLLFLLNFFFTAGVFYGTAQYLLRQKKNQPTVTPV